MNNKQKCALFVIALALMVVFSVIALAATEQVLLGDLNESGSVNTGDAILVLRHAAELEAFDDKQKQIGDVNQDSSVDTGDAICILRIAVGIDNERWIEIELADPPIVGGDGSSWDKAIIISTEAELRELAKQTGMDKYYKLGADIDLKHTRFSPIGSGFQHIAYDSYTFSGGFDGNGYAISNLYLTTTSADSSWAGYTGHISVGLFGNLNSADIRNVVVKNADVVIDDKLNGSNSNIYSVGILAGYADSSTIITNCKVSGNITCSPTTSVFIGGIVGWQVGGRISSCESSATIRTNSYYIGGVAGFMYGGRIEHTRYIGESITSSSKNGGVGGIAGDAAATINGCYSNGYIACAGSKAGGIAGISGGKIQSCWTAGTVVGNADDSSNENGVGGIVGYTTKDVTDSYTLCNVFAYSGSQSSSRLYASPIGKLRTNATMSNCHYIEGRFYVATASDYDSAVEAYTASTSMASLSGATAYSAENAISIPLFEDLWVKKSGQLPTLVNNLGVADINALVRKPTAGELVVTID